MTLAVLILAGGMSRRMGQDKALLELEGISLLRRTWNIAHTLTDAVWVVTSRPEQYQSLLPPNAQWIRETPPASDTVPPGPLVAFTQALTQIKTDWILLLACDL
ncbi:MAG: NTP transferase domain-containing protein, partial [Cyanobacteria bacterium J06636_16]